MKTGVSLARRGSGLRTAIKVVKAIDKANKRAARDAERRRKAEEREQAQAYREHQRWLNEKEREEKRNERLKASAAKQAFKDSLSDAQEEYNQRCLERAELRKQFIKEVLR
ncbi:hypothetical protein [Vibrio rotiferianus]|uniref:hypothetical protein n=1 Tax=Vibrio rotiferianus TaxID=190895 RepID=UPI0038B3648C